jgi:predicted TIM-barrel fold metal-dependent hydrolase
MWSSDYPHTDSPWPRSREFIETWSGTIREDQKQKVVGDNVANLYHLN